MANAEGDNWVALGYDGILLDTTCAKKASMYVEDIPCVEKFIALTHDGLEITGKLSKDILGADIYGQPEMLRSEKFTFVLYDEELTILSRKLKVKQQLQVSSLAEELEGYGDTKILKADDENIWILYNNHLLQYNHKTKNLIRLTNLTAWLPNQVLIDGEHIWLISGMDGRLYGLSL